MAEKRTNGKSSAEQKPEEMAPNGSAKDGQTNGKASSSTPSAPDDGFPLWVQIAGAVAILAIALWLAVQADSPVPLKAISTLKRGPSLMEVLAIVARYPVATVQFYYLRAKLSYKWWKATGIAPGQGQCLHKRFVELDFISQEDCDALMDLADIARTHQDVGDELTGTNIWELVQKNVASEDLELLKRVRIAMRDRVEWALPEDTKLYMEYTHLTSRTPGEFEYSHGLHADSCLLSEDFKECKELPDNCCAWRTRSALLYLNGSPDIEGGEFVFHDAECGGEVVVKPRCGLMASFSSGHENIHGVLRVTKGTRRAMAIWFSHDPARREQTPLDRA